MRRQTGHWKSLYTTTTTLAGVGPRAGGRSGSWLATTLPLCVRTGASSVAAGAGGGAGVVASGVEGAEAVSVSGGGPPQADERAITAPRAIRALMCCMIRREVAHATVLRHWRGPRPRSPVSQKVLDSRSTPAGECAPPVGR